jgi:bifunctional polynucleotide phosphatase/kinase
MWCNLCESIITFKSDGFKFCNKVACFDIDGTLIKTKSGKTFPINNTDWIWLYDNIITKIHELYNNNYCIIMISNQAILKTDKLIEEWKYKLNKMIQDLDIPILLFASLKKDKYRKPLPFIWREHVVSNIEFFDFENSFYCGDAIGRKNDHSDCDIKFASNCKLSFILPEELFLNEIKTNKQINYITFPKNKFDEKILDKFINMSNTMIIMIGYPASGKSTIASLIEKYNFYRINQDTLITKKKCLDMTINCLKNNINCVIDNTNPTKDKRKEYIDLANNYKYNIYCIHITTSYELSQHNNIYRYLTTNKNIIPSIVYNKYKKDFEEPCISEGYSEIIKVSCGLINELDYNLYYY